MRDTIIKFKKFNYISLKNVYLKVLFSIIEFWSPHNLAKL